MWIWASELHRLGFRRQSEYYWRCENRYGLPGCAYLSIFIAAIDDESAARIRPGRMRLDFSAFHVTYCLGSDRVHFYYHEATDLAWEPGGHTSSRELRRHGVQPAELRAGADDIAGKLAASMGCALLVRRRRTRDRQF